ncbi:hypothetical protein BDD12DRAFT_120777, partial [Trichophaea hybrida]
MSSLWLNKKKKAELVALCDQLGLDTDGCLKSDLEGMLAEYLQANETELSKAPQTRSRRRTSRYVGTASFDNASTDAESTPEPSSERKTRSGSRALATRTPRTVRSLREVAVVPLPPSPAVVADEIETRANAIIASAKKAVEKAEIHEKATGLRDRLSNVISVNATSLSLEAILLLISIIPVTYQITLPAITVVGTPAVTYILPDLFVILTAAFWAPFLTWLVTALVLPVGNALLFNLVSASVAKDAAEHPVDPLTYAVTRALLTYLVHYKGFSFWGLLGEKTVATVGT